MAQLSQSHQSRLPRNLADRTLTILRKRNFQSLTFQEFRAQYATTFNVVNPPERAKLMKLPFIKVSYSQKHKKQTMKVLIERDYICEDGNNCNDEQCTKLHFLKDSDECPQFNKNQSCNHPNCNKLHIPNKSLLCRICEIFKKANRSSMPFSKFIVLHRTTYPNLREHYLSENIIDSFSNIVKIENTEKTKEIRLLRRRRSGDKYSGIERPPSLSENIDAPYPALKITQFDRQWIDTSNLMKDIVNLFPMQRVKDIFIPGHMRMSFVTFGTPHSAQMAVKKLNKTWFCGRKVTVSLTEEKYKNSSSNDQIDEEKVPSSSSRIVIKAINNVISDKRIKEWLARFGRIQQIDTRFVRCINGSNVCYVHFKTMKIVQQILGKENKKNHSVIFRGKNIKFNACDDGYTDSSAYYSLQLKRDKHQKLNNVIDGDKDEQKQCHKPAAKIMEFKQVNFDKQEKDKNNDHDSMNLLVQRLKSLINATIETKTNLEAKLRVLAMINNNEQKQEENMIDVDIAFGDESYTIDAIKQSLESLKSDKNQIQVYKQALTAFETSQSRAINKNQRELKPVSDKEIELAKAFKISYEEIEVLEKKLALKRNEQDVIRSDLQIARSKAKTLRKSINEMKEKINPIRDALAAFDGKTKRRSSKRKILINADKIPSNESIKSIESMLIAQEQNINHWLKWNEWNLKDATLWIGQLEHGKFKQHLAKFNALSKISQGSILNAITDPTLQIIGIDNVKDRKCIIDNIAMLKSRTAMMKKSQSKFNRMRLKKSRSYTKEQQRRRGSVSTTSLHSKLMNHSKNNKQYGLDDLAMQEMIRSASLQSENSDNLCVICMDREIAPYAMVPCGHQCLCGICKNLIKPNKHKCPMCNGDVTMIIKLFRA